MDSLPLMLAMLTDRQQTAAIERARRHRAASMRSSIITAMASLRHGRSIVLLISGGWIQSMKRMRAAGFVPEDHHTRCTGTKGTESIRG